MSEWQVKLCDALVAHGPYLSALERGTGGTYSTGVCVVAYHDVLYRVANMLAADITKWLVITAPERRINRMNCATV